MPDCESTARISAIVPPMHFGRVKPALQLHAPRVCCVYIRLIPDTRKCLKSVLFAKRLLPEPSNRTDKGYIDNPQLQEDCGAGRGSRARTCDLRFWRPPLYQLSYTPNAAASFHKERHVSRAVLEQSAAAPPFAHQAAQTPPRIKPQTPPRIGKTQAHARQPYNFRSADARLRQLAGSGVLPQIPPSTTESTVRFTLVRSLSQWNRH